jgi:hypothetical protein
LLLLRNLNEGAVWHGRVSLTRDYVAIVSV